MQRHTACIPLHMSRDNKHLIEKDVFLNINMQFLYIEQEAEKMEDETLGGFFGGQTVRLFCQITLKCTAYLLCLFLKSSYFSVLRITMCPNLH